MDNKPANFGYCIQQLEGLRKEIQLPNESLIPDCQNLIILIQPISPSINFTQIIEKQIQDEEIKFYSHNQNSQIFIPHIKDNMKSDLIRHYQFKHIAIQYPLTMIKIIYLIPSNKIDELDRLLHDDFENLPNSNGLSIIFYDIPNQIEEWDQIKITQRSKDQNAENNKINSFLKNSPSRIIHLSNKQVTDIEKIAQCFELINGQYTTQQIEKLFLVDQGCEQVLILYKYVFQAYFDEKIEVFLQDISNHFYKFLIEQQFDQLLQFQQIEHTCQNQMDLTETIMQKSFKFFKHLKLQSSLSLYKDIKKYQEIIKFFEQDIYIGHLLRVQFRNIQITYKIAKQLHDESQGLLQFIVPENYPLQRQKQPDNINLADYPNFQDTQLEQSDTSLEENYFQYVRQSYPRKQIKRN